jgi:hypothetical protein
MANQVEIITARAICMAGQRVEPGTVLSMSALAAAPLVDSGKCLLRNTRDSDHLRTATTDDARRLCAAPPLQLGKIGTFCNFNAN